MIGGGTRAGPSLCPRRVVGEEEMADGSVAKVLPKDLGERLLLVAEATLAL